MTRRRLVGGWLAVSALGSTLGSTLGSALGSTLGAGCGVDGCFVRGTRVRTPEGWRSIETLAVGSMVLAFDRATGVTSARRVVRTFVAQSDELASPADDRLAPVRRR